MNLKDDIQLGKIEGAGEKEEIKDNGTGRGMHLRCTTSVYYVTR